MIKKSLIFCILVFIVLLPEKMNRFQQFPPVQRIQPPPLVSHKIDQTELFPLPDRLKPQYEFWKKVFSEYTSDQILIHDNWYLGVVYTVISLEASDLNSSERRKFVHEQAEFYRRELDQMMSFWNEPALMSAEQKRFRNLFKNIPDNPAHPQQEAARRIRVQSGMADHLMIGISRSSQYLEMIEAVLAEYRLPENLKYLPIIESMFNVRAVSHVGAAGMWQIMPATGKGVGLTIKHPLDERFDPLKSTQAAAEILRSNYERVNSWPLAITAYNHGLNGVINAVNSVGSEKIDDIIENYHGPRFRFASRNFYVEFLAAVSICSYYQQYFGHIEPEPAEPFVTVVLPDNLHPSALTEICQVPLVHLQKLNPSLHRTVFYVQAAIPEGYPLKLPPTCGMLLVAAYDNIPSQYKPSHIERTYRVKKDDTLSQIAAKNGVTLRQIMRRNNIRNPNELQSGQLLHIPTTGLNQLQAKK